jgi:hypothetical protein
LIHEEHHVCRYGVFKVRAGETRQEKAGQGPVPQNSTARNAEVDVLLGELGHRTTEAINEPSGLPE